MDNVPYTLINILVNGVKEVRGNPSSSTASNGGSMDFELQDYQALLSFVILGKLYERRVDNNGKIKVDQNVTFSLQRVLDSNLFPPYLKLDWDSASITSTRILLPEEVTQRLIKETTPIYVEVAINTLDDPLGSLTVTFPSLLSQCPFIPYNTSTPYLTDSLNYIGDQEEMLCVDVEMEEGEGTLVNYGENFTIPSGSRCSLPRIGNPINSFFNPEDEGRNSNLENDTLIQDYTITANDQDLALERYRIGAKACSAGVLLKDLSDEQKFLQNLRYNPNRRLKYAIPLRIVISNNNNNVVDNTSEEETESIFVIPSEYSYKMSLVARTYLYPAVIVYGSTSNYYSDTQNVVIKSSYQLSKDIHDFYHGLK